MAGQPGDPDFERRFIEWYVWAAQHVSQDPRRCRAAAWAAVTSTGTPQEQVAIAHRAASGPELEELAAKPDPQLAARAEQAAAAAKRPSSGWKTCGIVAAVIGVVLLLAGGACFALAAISSSGRPGP